MGRPRPLDAGLEDRSDGAVSQAGTPRVVSVEISRFWGEKGTAEGTRGLGSLRDGVKCQETQGSGRKEQRFLEPLREVGEGSKTGRFRAETPTGNGPESGTVRGTV